MLNDTCLSQVPQHNTTQLQHWRRRHAHRAPRSPACAITKCCMISYAKHPNVLKLNACADARAQNNSDIHARDISCHMPHKLEQPIMSELRTRTFEHAMPTRKRLLAMPVHATIITQIGMIHIRATISKLECTAASKQCARLLPTRDHARTTCPPQDPMMREQPSAI